MWESYEDLNYAQSCHAKYRPNVTHYNDYRLAVITMYANKIKYLKQQMNLKRKQPAFSKQIFQRALSNQNKHIKDGVPSGH